jgi:hypothetical protein
MPNLSEPEWTIIDSVSNIMTSTNFATTPAVDPSNDITVNTKPAVAFTEEEKVAETPSITIKPTLVRQDTIDSNASDDTRIRRRRASHRVRDDFSPVRNDFPSSHDVPEILTSPALLERVCKYDGIADLPQGTRHRIYITTYPFTNKDVKKWSWLFALNIEEQYLYDMSRGRNDDDMSDDDMYNRRSRRYRNISPCYEPERDRTIIPCVYLSRALDLEVVPEDAKNVSYLIVTQSRLRPGESQLLIVESRKAVGISVFYEALRGNSTVFVGAVVERPDKNVKAKRFRRVESLEEAVQVKEEGFVGVVC